MLRSLGSFGVSGRSPQLTQMQDEWSLMQRVSKGDDAAVIELYARFGALVFRSCYQTVGTRAEADDAVQEVFVQLWKTAARFDPERAKLITWVMLITRRLLIDRLRRKQAKPPGAALVGDYAAHESNPHLDSGTAQMPQGLLAKRLAELPNLQREVIERTYLQGFTLREVSVQLDTPLGTVKSALSRGLARLRGRLSADEALGL